jgi:fumarate reductase subunit C
LSRQTFFSANAAVDLFVVVVLIAIGLILVFISTIGIDSLWNRFIDFKLLMSVDVFDHVSLFLQNIHSSTFASANSDKLIVESWKHSFA